MPVTDERTIAGPPRIGMSWDAARAWADEDLHWSGVAMAAVGGWFGLRRRPCTIWLTASSLFWSHREGTGVNRLALADVADVQAGPYRTLVVSTTDGLGHRFDLPFAIERPSNGASPEAQLGAFLEVLRASGVTITSPTAPFAPWVRGVPPR